MEVAKNINDLLIEAVNSGGSDLHITCKYNMA